VDQGAVRGHGGERGKFESAGLRREPASQESIDDASGRSWVVGVGEWESGPGRCGLFFILMVYSCIYHTHEYGIVV